MSISLSKVRRILIIRFSSIGDIILTTSVVNTLKEQFPHLEIDFLTLERFAPLLEHQENIRRILVLDKNSGPNKIKRFGRELDESGYDLIIDLHNSLRSKIIMSGFARTKKLKLRKPRLNRFLLFYLTINRFPEDFNQVTLLHLLLKGLVDISKKAYPSLNVSENERGNAIDFLNQYGNASDYGICIPGAAWSNKIWPVEKYISFFRQFSMVKQWFLIGGPKDEICEKISSEVPGVIDLHGKTDMRESLSIIAGAKIVLGSDTGMVHAAEALGVPAVTILGPTSRETGAGVNRDFSFNVEKSPWCRPCSQNGSRKCFRKEQVCMTKIHPEDVTFAVEKAVAVKQQ